MILFKVIRPYDFFWGKEVGHFTFDVPKQKFNINYLLLLFLGVKFPALNDSRLKSELHLVANFAPETGKCFSIRLLKTLLKKASSIKIARITKKAKTRQYLIEIKK